MAFIPLTPSIRSTGLWAVRTPWVISETSVYVCHAIRSFNDLAKLGVDPYKAYYEPMGLNTAEYNDDVAAQANIITLLMLTPTDNEVANGRNVIYIPDTYITKLPNQNLFAYSHIVLSASLGPLPDYVGLELAMENIQNVVSEITGKAVVVALNRAPTTNAVTPAQHDILEAARLAAIITHESNAQRVVKLEYQLAQLQATYDALFRYATEEGILPPPP